MAKKNKPKRPQARLPRGFRDRQAAEIRATDAMMATIRRVYERYGFEPIETPMFEYTDALGKFLPDTDRPNEGVFSLTDDDDQWMSLRYDMTAPLARHVAEQGQDLVTPYRTYRAGYVFRNEKPGPGRFRQFMQFDADIVGAPGVSADAEICMMLADTMEELGIKRGDYVVRVNNRKVLDGVMEAIGLGGDENAAKRLGVLRSIDKLDKFGVEGVAALLGANGRTDESGDHTPGVGLSDEAIEALMPFLNAGVTDRRDSVASTNLLNSFVEEMARPDLGMTQEQIDAGGVAGSAGAHVMAVNAFRLNSQVKEGADALRSLSQIVSVSGYGPRQIQIDFSCVRGLEYYTGTVFEVELTFDVTNEKGETVQFGSVAGGGRYDGLVSRFTGQPTPATGASIGVSRLMTALRNLGKLDDEAVQAPVVVTVMDGKDPDAVAGYMGMAKTLRDAGIRAEMYQGNPNKFPKQLQYADRIGAPVAIIQGSDERERGVVQVKDLAEGKRLAENITSNEEWRAARVAQQEVPVDKLVETVRAILDSEAKAGS
ncbi:MAG: histidine--tRNA ligase [Pseudomonadota bacterium]